MAKRSTEPKFLPCVATHYRNVTVNMAKKVADIREQLTEKYNGHCAPDVMDALEKAQIAVQDALLALDAKSSKPIFSESTEDTQAS